MTSAGRPSASSRLGTLVGMLVVLGDGSVPPWVVVVYGLIVLAGFVGLIWNAVRSVFYGWGSET